MKKIILLMLIILSAVYANAPKSCLVWKKNSSSGIFPYSDVFQRVDTNQSIKVCKKTIKYFPNDIVYWYDLGRAYEFSKNQAKAFQWYSKAADKGHTDAQRKIADMYYGGRGVKEDRKKAISLFKKLANKNNVQAQKRLAQLYRDGDKPLTQNYKEAMKWYIKAAENNDTWAQRTIGSLYRYGEGVEKNIQSAISWYTKSANLNNNLSQKDLGDMYYEGKDISQDYNKAMGWYLKAAENKDAWLYSDGDAQAQIKIAEMYYDGVGTKKDYKKAFKWFMRAAEQGNIYAQYSIGYMYANGEWATKNYKKAFKWYMKAAERNNIDAQLSIGNMFINGQGAKKSYKKAMQWYVKASENGSIQANINIGYLYFKGRGVRKNNKKSFEWYMKASMQGNAESQVITGFSYYEGEGVKKNYVKAYAWLNLALSSELTETTRSRATQILDILELLMTQEQIAIAQEYNPLEKTKQVDTNSSSNKKKPEKGFSGTAFFVDKSTVLTNYHVVKNCKSIELVRKGYKSAAQIKAKDSINDLAILEADKTNSSSLNFRVGKGIRIGDDIIVIGYPLGELLGSGIKLTTGNVSALTGLINDTTSMQLTAPVQPGNSGGALLDTSGNVVGVVVARLKKEQNVNLAIKANVAQMFLDINNIDYGVAISKDKKDVADIADEAKESIVQVICYQ